MKSYVALIALLLLAMPAMAANYKMTDLSPVPVAPQTNVFLHVELENTGPDANLARVDIRSEINGIVITDRLHYIGDFPEDSVKIVPIGIHVGDIAKDEYKLTLVVFDSNGIHEGEFILPVGKGSFKAINLGTGSSSGTTDSSASSTDDGDWSCGDVDFEIKNTAYRGEDDARIDPTDKVELVVYLESRTTDQLRDVEAEISEDILGLSFPTRKYNYVDIGDRAEKAGYFILETDDLTPGGYVVDFEAEYVKKAHVCTAKIPLNITVSGDYGVRVDALQDTMEVAPAGTATIKVNIRNDGEANDIYKLFFRGVSNWVQEYDEAILVPSGESRDTYVKLYIPLVTGMYELGIGAESETLSSISDKDTVIIISDEDKVGGHGVLMSFNKHSSDVAPGKSVTFNLKVQNVGNTKDAVALMLEGPDWALLNPSTIELEPGAIKELELYVAPDADAAMGSHEIIVKASTFGGEATAEERIAVYVTDNPATTDLPETDEAGANAIAAATGFAILDFGKRSGLSTLVLLQTAIIAVLVLTIIRKTERPEVVVA